VEQRLLGDPNITLCLYCIPEQLMQQTLYKKIALAEKWSKHSFLLSLGSLEILVPTA